MTAATTIKDEAVRLTAGQLHVSEAQIRNVVDEYEKNRSAVNRRRSAVQAQAKAEADAAAKAKKDAAAKKRRAAAAKKRAAEKKATSSTAKGKTTKKAG
jgi:uncharacterized membrane protein YukC